MTKKLWGNEYRTTMVCVDTYENSVPVGRFYNPGSMEGIHFQSLCQLLLRMEEMLEGMQVPQSFTASRTFPNQGAADRGSGNPSSDGEKQGKLATFALRILFRQNASWQGSVTWLEGEREESFRSVLELILLMDSALSGG